MHRYDICPDDLGKRKIHEQNWNEPAMNQSGFNPKKISENFLGNKYLIIIQSFYKFRKKSNQKFHSKFDQRRLRPIFGKIFPSNFPPQFRKIGTSDKRKHSFSKQIKLFIGKSL